MNIAHALIEQRHAALVIVCAHLREHFFIALIPARRIARMLRVAGVVAQLTPRHGQLIQIHAVRADIVREIVYHAHEFVPPGGILVAHAGEGEVGRAIALDG